MNDYDLKQSCPSKSCINYEKSGVGFVAIHAYRPKRWRCRICGKTWSENYQEPYCGLRSEEKKVRRAMDLLSVDIPIRKIASYVNVSPSTVQRWKSRFNNNS